jgi:Eukaryotic protein of unknown function (DUF1764)
LEIKDKNDPFRAAVTSSSGRHSLGENFGGQNETGDWRWTDRRPDSLVRQKKNVWSKLVCSQIATMAKETASKTNSNKNNHSKQRDSTSDDSIDSACKSKKRGWDEIESLFQDKKKSTSSKQQTGVHRHASTPSKKKKHSPVEAAASASSSSSNKEWVNDGLGGRFNAEGFTGRVEDGVKIFKAHVLSKPDAGNTKLCPFDCDCCFI